MIAVTIDHAVTGLAIGFVEVTDATIAPAIPELREHCTRICERVKVEGPAGGEPRRQAIRSLLRAGGFKPAGRNKPAQEYLQKAFENDGTLPEILNVVDLLNAVSLASGLPISLLSASLLGERATLRYGLPGERYVFNRTGQELEVEGLLVVCATGADGTSLPVGSPVKDSMTGKVTEYDQHLLACIYGACDDITRDELTRWTQVLGQGFVSWCGASGFESTMLPEPG